MAAGDRIRAGDFPQAAHLDDPTDILAFGNTAYAQGTPVCGVTFTVPTSGKIRVDWKSRFENNTAGQRTVVSIEVATGATIGSGTVVSGGDDDSALETSQSATITTSETRMQCSTYRIIPGLTAGATYNAYVVHKVFGGTGDIFSRGISVQPMT